MTDTTSPFEPALHEALQGDRTPKFLGSLDSEGRPNCVPVISIMPCEGNTLVFGEFLMNKTRQNIEQNDKVGIAVLNADLLGWSLTGLFRGFETTGPHVDMVNLSPMFRYNAYTSVRAAGIIEVVDVSPPRQLTKLGLLCSYLGVRAAAALGSRAGKDREIMPLRVAEKFQRISAVRAMAFCNSEGFPRTIPLMACVPAGRSRLVLGDPLSSPELPSLPDNTEVAVGIITTDPVAYQVKGAYHHRRGRGGVLDLSACYSASPPLAGERLDATAPAVS